MYNKKNWLMMNDFFKELNDFNGKMFQFDTYKRDDEYFIEVMLPGFKKEMINIDYEDKKINIRVERKEDEKLDYIQKNTFFGKASETYTIPFEPDSIDAEYENGVLILKLKRKKENTPVIKFK